MDEYSKATIKKSLKTSLKLLQLYPIIWFFICLFAIGVKADEYSIAKKILAFFIGVIPIGLMIIIKILYKNAKDREVKFKQEMEDRKQLMIDNKTEEKINNLKRGIPIINLPNIYLGNAQLHFCEPAVLINTENKMVGFVNQSSGMVNETYSLYKLLIDKEYQEFRTSSYGTSSAVYEDITNQYNGQLAITSNSVLFIHQQKGFEIKLDDIGFMQLYADGLNIQSGDNAYSILIEGPKYFMAVLNMIRNNAIQSKVE